MLSKVSFRFSFPRPISAKPLDQMSTSFFAPFSSPSNLNRPLVWYPGLMTHKEIINDIPSSPAFSPSYPHGPYRFLNREYFIVSYETDRNALRRIVPHPLIPNHYNTVLYEWIKMPDSSGFGNYQESGTVIPCFLPDGREVNYTAQMFLDCEPPIACGREIWGFPKKYALPKMDIHHDTVCGSLSYANQEIARGTMAYKYKEIPRSEALKSLQKLSCNLKIIPKYDLSGPEISQLVGYHLEDIEVIGAWSGPARLYLNSCVNAPTNELPVRRIIGGKHVLANLTLPYGEVLHDYIATRNNNNNNNNNRKEQSYVITSEKRTVVDQQKQGPTDTAPATLHPITLCNPIEEFDLTEEKVLALPSMPAISPSYPLRAPRLQNREMLIIVYETDRDALLPYMPEEVEADETNRVIIQWSNTEGTGLGAYSKCSLHVPCRLRKEKIDPKRIDNTDDKFIFSIMNIIDCSSTITIGREIFGQPTKFGYPMLSVNKDTLTATVKYGDQEVARASMTYKHRELDLSRAYRMLESKELNLKLIPDVRGEKAVAQLIENHFEEVHIRSAYCGPVRLDFVPHVNAPFSDLPVRSIIEGAHLLADVRMTPGSLIHDYLNPN